MLAEYEAITHDDIMVRHGLEYRAANSNIARDLLNDMDAAFDLVGKELSHVILLIRRL